jgi:hypothetical protein
LKLLLARLLLQRLSLARIRGGVVLTLALRRVQRLGELALSYVM